MGGERVRVLGAVGGGGGGDFLEELPVRKGRHVGSEGGGHGSMWAVGAVGVVGAVWVCG